MGRLDLGELARRLGNEAEAVCRRYLSKGRCSGRYWLVGDIHNTPGCSLFVRLSGPGAAGRWTDAATGQHGDLLDLIGHAIGSRDFPAIVDEACAFLSLPRAEITIRPERRPASASADTSDLARRLFARAKPIDGTMAQAYLQHRALVLQDDPTLRYDTHCAHAGDPLLPPGHWPALIAAVTDLDGIITGVQRTYLARDGSGKAPLASPRRALGRILGHAVRFGDAHDLLAAGEGIETMLSLRAALPALPMASALSANNLAALHLPRTLRRLYIARDDDPAGHRAAAALEDRAATAGIEAIVLSSERNDFNDDLVAAGPEALRDRLLRQLMAQDGERMLG